MKKYRELWDSKNFKAVSPRDYYWRDCTKGLEIDSGESMAAKIIGGVCFAFVFIGLIIL